MQYKLKENSNLDIKREPNPWDVREKEIIFMVKDYLKEFQNSQLLADAKIAGTEAKLIRYVIHIATIQAKMIKGAKVGFDFGLIFGYNKKPNFYEIKRWLEDQRIQCSNGNINVEVPANAY